jgi:uncharacterized cupredoxin-like copper-binding protein
MKSKNMLRAALAVAATGLVAVPFASAARKSPAVSLPSTVVAKETEFKIALDHVKVRAGKVTFVVDDTGRAPHELVVLRTPTDAGKLKRTATGRATEIGNVTESGDLKPGQARKFTVSLRPGHYALICNIAGHYAAGMFANFTVS